MNEGHCVHRPALHQGEEVEERLKVAEEPVEEDVESVVEHCMLGFSRQVSRVVSAVAAVTRVRENISTWGDSCKHAPARLLLVVGI